MEWKPIDCAPRKPNDAGDDWLLGWNAEWDGALPIYWWFHGWVTPDQAVRNYGEAADNLYRILPTHWMPLPEPPKDT